MSVDQTMTQRLGVNKDLLADKCSVATKWLLESKLLGGKTTDEFIDHMEVTFTSNELMFLAIGFITEKTETIMSTDPAIAAIIDKAAIKHGVPSVLVDLVKESLGIKKEDKKPTSEEDH